MFYIDAAETVRRVKYNIKYKNLLYDCDFV